jgi:hypothetical protein
MGVRPEIRIRQKDKIKGSRVILFRPLLEIRTDCRAVSIKMQIKVFNDFAAGSQTLTRTNCV